jgi:hypothetical protein
MKKIISFAALFMLICCSLAALTSCSDELDEGTYVSADGISFVVEGGSFVYASGNAKGYADYEIDGDKLRLSFDRVEYIGPVADADEFEKMRELVETRFKNQVCRTFSFERVEGGIKLDGLTFTKI